MSRLHPGVLFLLLLAGCGRHNPPPLPVIPINDFPGPVREDVQTKLAGVKAKPEDAASNGELGMVLDANSRQQAAEVCYLRASALEPKDFKWAYYLGVNRMQQNKNSEAIASLRVASRLNPGFIPTRIRIADCLYSSGKLEDSLAEYRQILVQNPKCAQAHYGIGRILAIQDRWSDAEAAYLSACKYAPTMYDARYGLSIAYLRLGDKKRAAVESEAARKTEHEPSIALMQDEDKYLSEITSLKRSATYFGTIASQLIKAGNKQQAAYQLEKGLLCEPKHLASHTGLIALYQELHQYPRAEDHYRIAMSIDPNYPNLHNNYGALCAIMGKRDLATEEFRKELAINPRHAGAHNNLGDELVIRKKIQDALKEYRLAVKWSPGERIAHSNVASCLIQLKRYREAVEELKRILSPEDENSPTYLTNLALAYKLMGNRVEAKEAAKKAQQSAISQSQSELLQSRILPLVDSLSK